MKKNKKAIFLDRDGIINIDKSYVYRYEDIEWMPGIFELVAYANAHDFLVIVLTNQSGIERGLYAIEDVLALHSKMNHFFQSKNLIIDDWFFSESLSGNDRKPAPGMLIKARDKYQIDLSISFMVGDKASDVLDLVGPEYLLLKGSYDLSAVDNSIKKFDDLETILNYIKSISQ